MKNDQKLRFFFLKLWFLNIIKKILYVFNKFKTILKIKDKKKEKSIDEEENNGWG